MLVEYIAALLFWKLPPEPAIAVGGFTDYFSPIVQSQTEDFHTEDLQIEDFSHKPIG